MAGVESDVRSVAAADGVALEYEVLGQGPTVVLVHGALGSRLVFSRQRSALAERYRLILPSARGHDGTTAVWPNDYGINGSEIDDLRAVLAAEGTDRIRLIGHSSGGAVCFAFARRFPERVDRMVLIEPSLLAHQPNPPELIKLAETIEEIAEIGEAQGDMAALRATLDMVAGHAWRQLDEETKTVRLKAMQHLATFVVPHWRALFSHVVADADLQALQPPTLLLYGDASFAFEAAIAARFQSVRPDLPQILLPDAGHAAHLERADIATPAILDFLNDGASS